MMMMMAMGTWVGREASEGKVETWLFGFTDVMILGWGVRMFAVSVCNLGRCPFRFFLSFSFFFSSSIHLCFPIPFGFCSIPPPPALILIHLPAAYWFPSFWSLGNGLALTSPIYLVRFIYCLLVCLWAYTRTNMDGSGKGRTVSWLVGYWLRVNMKGGQKLCFQFWVLPSEGWQHHQIPESRPSPLVSPVCPVDLFCPSD
jgi:hypothetical protein